MAIKNTTYYLSIDDFDSVMASYAESLNGFQVSKEVLDDHIIFRFKKDTDKKSCSNLHCYIKQGRVSFYIDGKDKGIAEKSKLFLIEHTELKVGESKTFTVKPATPDEVDTVADFLCEVHECAKQELENTNETIDSVLKITGKHKDSIRLTYYKTGTLLVQGRPSFTFNNFIEIAAELFNPIEVKREHLKLFDIVDGDDVINSDLSAHLPDAYEHIGGKLDAIMAPSLILLNNSKELPDYSAYAFPVLRGSEGVLKRIFVDEGIPLNDFGEYFGFDRTSGRCEWVEDKSVLFPNDIFRNKLLALYRFYHAHRHTTFHVDATIDTTRTLSYDEAIAIVKEGLKLINDIYIHLS